MGKVTGSFKKDMERYHKGGVTKVKVKHQNDTFVCVNCRTQQGTLYTIGESVTVPHNCTSKHGCRCFLVPMERRS